MTLQVESKYVVCSNGAEKKVVLIYDLLHAFGYHFKLKNKILYVGYSENPRSKSLISLNIHRTKIFAASPGFVLFIVPAIFRIYLLNIYPIVTTRIKYFYLICDKQPLRAFLHTPSATEI